MFKLTTLPPLHTLLFVIIRTILVEIWDLFIRDVMSQRLLGEFNRLKDILNFSAVELRSSDTCLTRISVYNGQFRLS